MSLASLSEALSTLSSRVSQVSPCCSLPNWNRLVCFGVPTWLWLLTLPDAWSSLVYQVFSFWYFPLMELLSPKLSRQVGHWLMMLWRRYCAANASEFWFLLWPELFFHRRQWKRDGSGWLSGAFAHGTLNYESNTWASRRSDVRGYKIGSWLSWSIDNDVMYF